MTERTVPIDRDVARQAAHWLMRMHAGRVPPADQQACAHWRAAHPDHERAWQRVQQVQQKLGLLPTDLAMGTLNRERRHALKTLLVLATLLPAGYLTQQTVSRQHWLADMRTGVGERGEHRLSDGSQLFLNTDSAVDLAFTAHERRIYLRHGELLIDSGTDKGPHAYRPLRVVTSQGVMQALGTRFSVARQDERALTRLAVFEGAVRIHTHTGATATLTAGQQVSFSSDAIGPHTKANEFAASWTRGQLVADGLPLSEFIAELSRYRHGWLRCDPDVAALRISGTFQLDNTDAILAALPHTLPVALEQRTRYWITLRRR